MPDAVSHPRSGTVSTWRGWFSSPDRSEEERAAAELKLSRVHDLKATIAEMDELTQCGQRSSASIADNQKKLAEQVSSIAGLAGQIAADAESISESCITSRQKSEHCKSVMDSLFVLAKKRQKVIQDQSGHVERSVAAFDNTNASLEHVEAVLAHIIQIGTQTNMLALNASIEAARAGVHGAGFSVVAEEVRALASRTRSATDDIASTIKGMRSSIASAREAMAASAETVQSSQQHHKNVYLKHDELYTTLQAAADDSTRSVDAASNQHQAVEELRRHAVWIDESQRASGQQVLDMISFGRQARSLVSQLFRHLAVLAGADPTAPEAPAKTPRTGATHGRSSSGHVSKPSDSRGAVSACAVCSGQDPGLTSAWSTE